jgi:PleD family two-component response regulator
VYVQGTVSHRNEFLTIQSARRWADMYSASQILVVEDSSSIREVVSQALRLAGYRVVECRHVQEVLNALDDSRERFFRHRLRC